MSSNKLLSCLSHADSRLLEPHLEPVDLPVRKRLEIRKKRIDNVYFPDSGLASVVAGGADHIEIGMIGREGMTGLSVVLDRDGDDRALHETYMQIGGSGRRMPAEGLRGAIDASVSLHRALLRYAHAFLKQTTQTALANARHKIEERLARWLLMVHDRVDGCELRLTHDFMAAMLGVKRPGVTLALQSLARTGLIAHRRGLVTILDREALEKRSNGAYVRLNDQ